MLFQAALPEMPLLLFSVLLPVGIAGSAYLSLARGFGAGEDVDRKLDKLATIPLVIAVAGLIAATFHLGKITNIFYMVMGLGTSPLTNEIVVAGVSLAVAAVFWLVGLVKHPGRKVQRVFGIVLAILSLVLAVFVGIAYGISTVPTWDTAFSWLGEIFLVLVGGAVVATVPLGYAGAGEDRGSKLMLTCALVGALGAIAVVYLQGVYAGGLTSSAGTDLSALMGQYYAFATVGSILVLLAVIVMYRDYSRARAFERKRVTFAAILVLVGLFLIRVDFYGIYLSIGLA